MRVCEDKPGLDQILAEFSNDETSAEHFDEFMERKGVHLFPTRFISLNPFGVVPIRYKPEGTGMLFPSPGSAAAPSSPHPMPLNGCRASTSCVALDGIR